MSMKRRTFALLLLGTFVFGVWVSSLIDEMQFDHLPMCQTGTQLAEEMGGSISQASKPSMLIWNNGTIAYLPVGAQLPKGWKYHSYADETLTTFTNRQPEEGGLFSLQPPSGRCGGYLVKYR